MGQFGIATGIAPSPRISRTDPNLRALARNMKEFGARMGRIAPRFGLLASLLTLPDQEGNLKEIHNLIPPAPDGVLECNFDKARAVASLLVNGTLSRFPDAPCRC
jgi:hypothetical protein